MLSAKARRSTVADVGVCTPTAAALTGRLGTAFAALGATGHWNTNIPTTSAAMAAACRSLCRRAWRSTVSTM